MTDSMKQTFAQLLSHLPLDEQSPTDLFDAAESRLGALRCLLEVFSVVDNLSLPTDPALNGAFAGMALLAADAQCLYAYASPRRQGGNASSD